MKLNTKTRDSKASKSVINQLRRGGGIPAVVYSAGKPSYSISIDAPVFQKVLREIEKGSLPTTRFTLVDEAGKETSTIIKGIQYHLTRYDVTHLDFEELQDNKPVKLKVPIRHVGAVECSGVKLGGTLRSVIRHMRVKCLPKDIPAFFEIDVLNLNLNESRYLRDIPLAEGVKALDNLKEVAVVVAKR